MNTSAWDIWDDNDARGDQLYYPNSAPNEETAPDDGDFPEYFAALREGNYPFGFEHSDDTNPYEIGCPYVTNELDDAAAQLEGNVFIDPAILDESNGLGEVVVQQADHISNGPVTPNEGNGLGETAALHPGNVFHGPATPNESNGLDDAAVPQIDPIVNGPVTPNGGNDLGEAAAPLEGNVPHGAAISDESNDPGEVAVPQPDHIVHFPDSPNEENGLGEDSAPHEGNVSHSPTAPPKDNVPQVLGGLHAGFVPLVPYVQSDAALSLPINEELPVLTDITTLLRDAGSTPSSSNRLSPNSGVVGDVTDQAFSPMCFTEGINSIEPAVAPNSNATGSPRPRRHTRRSGRSFTGTQPRRDGARPVNRQAGAAITSNAAETQGPGQTHTTQTAQMAGPGQPHMLKFRNAEEAVRATQAHLVVRHEVDETYPWTEDENQAYVKRIMAALTNTTDTRDYPEGAQKVPQAYSKFAENQYTSEHIESQAWIILDKMKQRKGCGPLVAPFQRTKKHYDFDTFEKLTASVCKVLKEQKTICKRLMDAAFIDEFIDNPDAQLKRAVQNRRLNQTKAKQIKRGREVLGSSTSNAAPRAKRARSEASAEPSTVPGNIIEGGRGGEDATSHVEAEAAVSVVEDGNDHSSLFGDDDDRNDGEQDG